MCSMCAIELRPRPRTFLALPRRMGGCSRRQTKRWDIISQALHVACRARCETAAPGDRRPDGLAADEGRTAGLRALALLARAESTLRSDRAASRDYQGGRRSVCSACV